MTRGRIEEIVEKHEWAGGRILRYPAHGIDCFVLCSEADLKLMGGIVKKYGEKGRIDFGLWPEIKKTGEYEELLESVRKTKRFLDEIWGGGREFAESLLGRNIGGSESESGSGRSLLEDWCLSKEFYMYADEEDQYGCPLIGVELGKEELGGGMLKALNEWWMDMLTLDFDFDEPRGFMVYEMYEQVEYASARHEVWNEFVGD